MIGRITAICEQARADARAGRREVPAHHADHYVHAWRRERDRMKASRILPQTELAFCIVSSGDSACNETP